MAASLFLNLILKQHPKEDLYPPAAVKRDHHSCEGSFLGYPMGSGEEH